MIQNNTLIKLQSTAAQVDDLKLKLAAQEVELAQKNEDADKLIEKVGVETVKGQSIEYLNTILKFWAILIIKKVHQTLPQ